MHIVWWFFGILTIGILGVMPTIAQMPTSVKHSTIREENPDVVKEWLILSYAFQGDVTKQEDLENLYSDINKQFGRLDIIFANAGIGEFTLLDEATDEHFDRMFNVNTKGVFFTIQRALPFLMEGSSIIINASISGIKGFERLEGYSASKAAARSPARTLSADLVKKEFASTRFLLG